MITPDIFLLCCLKLRKRFLPDVTEEAFDGSTEHRDLCYAIPRFTDAEFERLADVAIVEASSWPTYAWFVDRRRREEFEFANGVFNAIQAKRNAKGFVSSETVAGILGDDSRLREAWRHVSTRDWPAEAGPEWLEAERVAFFQRYYDAPRGVAAHLPATLTPLEIGDRRGPAQLAADAVHEEFANAPAPPEAFPLTEDKGGETGIPTHWRRLRVIRRSGQGKNALGRANRFGLDDDGSCATMHPGALKAAGGHHTLWEHQNLGGLWYSVAVLCPNAVVLHPTADEIIPADYSSFRLRVPVNGEGMLNPSAFEVEMVEFRRVYRDGGAPKEDGVTVDDVDWEEVG